MNSLKFVALLISCMVVAPALAQNGGTSAMTFFVTSVGSGKGADFGGLEGADKHCQALATEVGAGRRVWRAYLSASAENGKPAVNARDRIGKGPWQNAKGVVVAKNLDDLHDRPNIDKQTAITERGAPVNGRGDTPNMHDILTGSTPEGRAFPPDKDTTCKNWMSHGTGAAMVGHHDRLGLTDDAPARSWSSSHLSRGCSLDALKASGGNGFLYCFAQN